MKEQKKMNRPFWKRFDLQKVKNKNDSPNSKVKIKSSKYNDN